MSYNSALAQLSDTIKAAVEDVKANRNVDEAKKILTKSIMALAVSDLTAQHVQNPDMDKQLKITVARQMNGIHKSKKPDFGQPLQSMAKEVYDRFVQKDLRPRPLISGPNVTEDTVIPVTPNAGILDKNTITQAQNDMMRGLHRPMTASGPGAAVVSEGYPIRSSKAYGHNGLTPGQWWPFRACLRRDGAHAAPVAGIYGSGGGGAMAIVSSGGQGYEGSDIDHGDYMEYSGSRGDGQSTQYLRDSLASGNPVRVIRGSGVHRWGPEIGLRYDGLYEVVNTREGKDGTPVFTLRRLPGQEALSSIVARSPSSLEKAAYKDLPRYG